MKISDSLVLKIKRLLFNKKNSGVLTAYVFPTNVAQIKLKQHFICSKINIECSWKLFVYSTSFERGRGVYHVVQLLPAISEVLLFVNIFASEWLHIQDATTILHLPSAAVGCHRRQDIKNCLRDVCTSIKSKQN